jgi:Tol biopolymer transport system component
MSLDDLQPHLLTSPPADTIGDFFPIYSPDGKAVAFVRLVAEGNADLYVVSASGGTVRQLTFDKAYILGVAWSADGKDLIFSSHRGGSQSLWFVPTVGAVPQRLPLGGAIATYPAISRQGNRLTYTQGHIQPNLWIIDLAGSHVQAKPFLSSATYNNAPRFSPDGQKIAFVSRRSGDNEIWTCAPPDCAEPQQLTFLNSLSGTPRWSPDGKYISFESRPKGHSQIFVVHAEGGKPRPITEGTAEDKVSSWSSDGKFIYFSSNRSGASEIWKISADGGRASQVTRHGGFASWESSDGRFLYYVKGDQSGIWRMLSTGGDETRVLAAFPAGRWGDWALVDRGVFYADESGARPAIKFLNFANHKVSKIVEVESLPPYGDPGFTVSPDEKQLVFSQIDRSAVLMLVENFNVEP